MITYEYIILNNPRESDLNLKGAIGYKLVSYSIVSNMLEMAIMEREKRK